MEFSSWDNDFDNKIEINEDNDDVKKEEYIVLLNRKLALEKEASLFDIEYVQKFGDLIEKSFKLKIQCIKYKKILAIYFRMKNIGESFDAYRAVSELADELLPYYQDLKNLQNTINDKGEKISDFTHAQIKKIYKEIVNLIHPDIAPELSNNRIIQKLWNEATMHYKCNQFEKLQEVYFLIMDELEKIGYDTSKKINVINIDDKISKLKERIKEIINTNPYQYKFLLENDYEVQLREKELQDEVDIYTDYLNDLTAEIRAYGIDLDKFEGI